MNRLIFTISCLICVLTSENSGVDRTGSARQFELFKSFGNRDNTLSWVVRDLVQEVKSYKELLSEQGKMMKLVSEQGKMIASKMEGMESDLKQALDQIDSLKNRIDIIRSEVRLISQQKLTWHNSTHNNRHFSDYAVDGVYRLANDGDGMNPIQHTDDNSKGPNNMVIVDLGALFKIHTVKLWRRPDLCCDHRDIGLLIYADDTLIGATSDARRLYNLPVNGDVYASKIYVKQPKLATVNFLEIQVFGTGPFGKDELKC